jgi:hypothetical protein
MAMMMYVLGIQKAMTAHVRMPERSSCFDRGFQVDHTLIYWSARSKLRSAIRATFMYPFLQSLKLLAPHVAVSIPLST